MIHHGSASLLAAREVVRKGMTLASQHLEVAEADLEFTGGTYRVKGTDRSVALLDLARKHPTTAGVHPLDAGGDMAHTSAFPGGAHVAEVEIDPDTGVTKVVKYTAVNDFGTVINPMIVAGQLHGGVAQGIGQALLERTVYDEEGQLLTGSFMDYCLPRADDLPSFDFNTRPVLATTNPLGVKGCGEAGCAGGLPTIVNAVLDALAERGITHIDTPLSPARVWQALREAR